MNRDDANAAFGCGCLIVLLALGALTVGFLSPLRLTLLIAIALVVVTLGLLSVGLVDAKPYEPRLGSDPEVMQPQPASSATQNGGRDASGSCLAELAQQAARIRSAIGNAEAHYTGYSSEYQSLKASLSFLAGAQSLRKPVASVLGYYWGAVLVATTVCAALLLVTTYSTTYYGKACILGAIFGAAISAILLYVPPDSSIASRVKNLQERKAAVESQMAPLLSDIRRLKSQLCGVDCRYKALDEQVKEKERQDASRLRREQLARRDWRALRGDDMEGFLAEVFSELQYLVDNTGKTGDQGVGLIVSKDGHRIAVQVKGYAENVPNTAIQEAHTGMYFYRCEACAVITNSRFTASARSIADGVGCVLIDGDSLPMLIRGQIDLWQKCAALRTPPAGTT